jgi:hypothetical protein
MTDIDIPQPPPNISFSNLKELHYVSNTSKKGYPADSVGYKILIELMKRSPNLTSLGLDLGLCMSWSDIGEERFKNMIQNASFSNLKKLDIRYYDSRFGEFVINTTSMLEDVIAGGWSFDGISLEHHFNSLQQLDLTRLRCINGATMRDILLNCPNLLSLKASTVKVSELVISDPSTNQIAAHQDWVCLNIKSLELYFDMSSNRDETATDDEDQVSIGKKIKQEFVIRQLSRLIQLESLDISPRNYTRRSYNLSIVISAELPESLNLTLHRPDGKLEMLGTLKKLKRFSHVCTFDTCGIIEHRWMEDNWIHCKLDDPPVGVENSL